MCQLEQSGLKLSGSWEETGNSWHVFAVLVLPMPRTPVFGVSVPCTTNMIEERNGHSLMSQKVHVQFRRFNKK